ncbi:MAG: ribosome maturation factor RimM [Oscillospiraceae bacterium]|nr:ribosome maturation factor RimM [Oscillospiraceae bacterium]
MKPYLEIGRAVTTHGLAGELKLYCWCDGPEVVCAQERLFLDGEGSRSLKIERARAQKNMCLVKFEGVNSVEEARAYIERVFWAKRESIPLPEGRVLISDLLGVRVLNEAQEELGRIKDVISGAQDILRIELADGSERLVPFVDAFVKSVDVEKGELVISPIRGLLDDED